MKTPGTDQSRCGRHVVILCHPEPGSFNHAIADAYCSVVRANGQDVVVRDLYAMGFDPVLKARERPSPGFVASPDIMQELALVDGGDVFVLIYPIWFGSPPAMMKGYVERILGSGVEPDAVQRSAPSSLLGNKRLVSFSTSAAAASGWTNRGRTALSATCSINIWRVPLACSRTGMTDSAISPANSATALHGSICATWKRAQGASVPSSCPETTNFSMTHALSGNFRDERPGHSHPWRHDRPASSAGPGTGASQIISRSDRSSCATTHCSSARPLQQY